jgi:ABC-type multidrug transport system ATPase subunit
VQDFDLLILDEVLANVDEPSRNMILSFIKEHYPEQTFIYISHNVSEVALFSKKIFVLQEAGTSGLSSLVSIPGLDIKHPRQAERSRAQEKILEILQAASSKDWQDTE